MTRPKSMPITASHPGVSHRAGKVGALLAVASLPVHFVMPIRASEHLAAITLALIAGIYVGFALQDGRLRIVATEVGIALAFAGCALLGLWITPWAVPAAVALHGVWDLAHHRHVTTAIPRWYVPFCAIYDVVFALGLAVAWCL